jgi:hypothetical protein
MSVKKSLWLSGALVMALSLFFLGCPTEADSSSETASYERTALWAAVVEAQTDLTSTQVSDLTGNDIAPSAKWVTTVQYTAFKQAIEKARQVAYTLHAAAAAPTPAEEAPIAELTAAKDTFNGQKQVGTATVVSAADLATGITGNNIITGTLSPATVVTISSGTLTIAPGAKLTVTTGVFTLNGSLTVKAGGTFEIASGAGTPAGTGAIKVESGATVIDGKGFTTGSYVIKAGGALIAEGKVLVGPSSGSNKGTVFQLTSGAMTIKIDDSYALNGDATLVSELIVKNGGVDLSGTSTLTIGNLVWTEGSEYFATTVGTGAKVILRDAGSSITVLEDGSNDGLASDPFAITDIAWVYDSATATKGWISGPAVLVCTTTGGTAWAKQ